MFILVGSTLRFLTGHVCFTRDHSSEWNCEVKRVLVRLYGKYAKFDIQDIGRGYRAGGELFYLYLIFQV